MREVLESVVVADIVGSTALRARIGDARMEELRRRVDEVLGHAVATHRGTVRSWLGDGCEAVFGSATDALGAAQAMTEWTWRDNDRQGRPAAVDLRVGVDGGPSTEAVDGAHRLCATAIAGSIAVSARALQTAGSWSEWTVEPDADHFRLTWTPARLGELLGRPARFGHPHPDPLLGREREVAGLEALIDVSGSEVGRVAVIAGEGGMGKTRLVHHVVDLAVADRWLVLSGSYDSAAVDPHQAVAEMLDQWVASVPESRIRLGRAGSELGRLSRRVEAMGLTGDEGTGDAAADRARLIQAVASWVEELATASPVLLVIENTHEAGEATRELLGVIAETVRRTRGLVICTTRDANDEIARITGATTHLVLEPLAGPAIAGICASLAPELGAADLEPLVAQSGGNALFAVELTRHRLSAGEAGTLPETVQRATAARVAALDPQTARVLQAAAVLGPQFELKSIAEVTEAGDELYDALDASVDAGILAEPTEPDLVYRFTHDMIRQALYEQLGAARRARLHEKAGLALERLGGVGSEPGRLAEHFAAAAGLGHGERAAHHALAAGHQARIAFAMPEAVSWYRRGLDLAGDGPTPLRADFLTGLGAASRAIGEDGWADRIAEAARIAEELGDGARLGAAALADYRGTFTRALRVDATKVARLRRALELLPEDDLATRARLHSALGLELEWSRDPADARRESDLALELAERLGDDQALAAVLSHRLWSLYHPTRDRIATTERLLEIAERIGSPLLRFEAAGLASFTSIRLGDPVSIERHLTTVTDLAGTLDVPLVRWQALLRQWPWALATGRYDDCASILDEYHRLGVETGHPDAEQAYATQRFWLDHDRRPLDDSRAFFGMMLQIVDQISPVAWPSWGHVLVELGMRDEAGAMLERVAASRLDVDRQDQLFLVRLFDMAVMAESAGDAQLGARLVPAIESHVDLHANMVFVTYGSMDRALGLALAAAGNRERAALHLRRAADRNRDAGLGAWEARALLDLARLDPGSGDDARERAAAIAAAWRLPVVAARAESAG